MPSSAEQVDYELKHGCLWIRMNNGRYWCLRRNGATKFWKRNPFRYRIPVKAGMYVYSEITNETEIGPFDSNAAIICSFSDPNIHAKRTNKPMSPQERLESLIFPN